MKNKIKKKMGAREKLKVDEKMLAKIENLSGNQLTQKQMASFFGISHVTWHKMKDNNPQMEVALRKGKAQMTFAVASKLLTQVNNGNVKAMMFFLERKGGWIKKNSLTVKGNVKSENLDFEIDTADPIEASKIYQAIMTGSYNNERNGSSK